MASMTESLCLMVRNEESKLAACLQSAVGLVDETIVVDTGSTDGTRELAAKLGAKVFESPWCDDFAAGRNKSIRHATGDWIFWMDADERLGGPSVSDFFPGKPAQGGDGNTLAQTDSNKPNPAAKVPPKGPGIPTKKNLDPKTVAKWQSHFWRDPNPYPSSSYFRAVLCQPWPKVGKVAKTQSEGEC